MAERVAMALRARASGLNCDEAAVELLAGHRAWLSRDDFVAGFVEAVAEDEQAEDSQEMAVLDWRGALEALEHGELGCSSSEGQVLRLAGSLACGAPVNLQDALRGLDATNAGLVAAAVLHAAGHAQAGRVVAASLLRASPLRRAAVEERLQVTLRPAGPDLDLAERG
jgi:hypothetical protein